MSQSISVLVIGVGGVGTHVLSQLSCLQRKFPTLKVALIANSRTSISSTKTAINLSTWAEALKSADAGTKYTPEQTLSFAKSLCINNDKAILIDNTSGLDYANIYSDFLRAGVSIATPNKKGFSSTTALWTDIFSNVYSSDRQRAGHVYHESTVGAGLPIISTLNDLTATGDKIVKIEGVFSGTMSFLFNNFAPAGSVSKTPALWSDVVKQAKEAGYTEPDPRDDLNGVDVARKLVILARLAGLDVDGVTAFPVQSLIPKELESATSGEDFLAKLPDFDARMNVLRQDAETNGKVIRFVGSIDVARKCLQVGLEELDKSNPIAAMQGSDNIVRFYTERYGDNPLVIQGAGAGGAVTAMGVTADVIKIVQRYL